ncbi:MAG: glutaredoxin family protein [Deltaproteobacteria bacterium]|nr:glutaredoxin family protein [Deltaproteobacteria bacterium]
MKNTIKPVAKVALLIGALFFVVGCPDKQAKPPRPEAKGDTEAQTTPETKGPDTGEDIVKIADLSDSESSGIVDVKKATKLLADNKLDDLLDVFEPGQVPKLSKQERLVLADIFYSAAKRLKVKYKDISYSSLYCERGLMLNDIHQPLLRLQIRNYLHPDMKLFGGAEELAIRLVKADGANQENQFLRGKVAYDQAEYDVAVVWLKKAARVGRTQKSKMVRKAWHLLDMAKGHQEEIKSALSMTRELEVMLSRARLKSRNTAGSTPDADIEKLATNRLAGGDITLYMTHWCGYCTKTRKLLQSLKVPFDEKNIEKDQRALMEMMKLAEKNDVEITGVPVIRIGNKLVVGYNRQRIEELVKRIK